MPLPKQVQDQVDLADQIEEGLTAPPPNPDPAPPTPEPQPEPAPAPQAPTADLPAVPEETWQKKFSTLQGIHRADVQRLTTERDDWKTKYDAAKAQLDAKPQEPTAPVPTKLTAADIENFGEDLVDLVKRAADERIAAETGPLKAQLAAAQAEVTRLNGTVTDSAETQAQAATEQFYKDVAAAAPEWEQINPRPDFHDWLAETDTLSGYPRQTLLDDAANKRDAKRVAAMFNAFKATLTVAPPPTPTPTPVPTEDKTLTSQIAPGQARTAVPPTEPQQPRTWTAQAIDAHYKALARGEYRSKPDEAAAIEAEIDHALAHGLVTA